MPMIIKLFILAQTVETDYWFCRDLPTTTKLLKYLNEQGWTVDWQEKPFIL